AWTRRSPNASRHALTVHALDHRSGQAPSHPSHPASKPPGIVEPVLRPVSCRRTSVTVPHQDIGDSVMSQDNRRQLSSEIFQALELFSPEPDNATWYRDSRPGPVIPPPQARSLLLP